MDTPRVILRAMEPEDIDLLYRWENDMSIWNVSNTLAPFSRHILQKYIETSHLDIYQTKQLRLMIDYIHDEENKCRTVGMIDLFDFDPYHNRAGIGILIGDASDRGKGIAGLALKNLIHYAFNTLKLHLLYCNIEATNEASINLFKKFGFEICGQKKQWLKTLDGFDDEYLLQLINNHLPIS